MFDEVGPQVLRTPELVPGARASNACNGTSVPCKWRWTRREEARTRHGTLQWRVAVGARTKREEEIKMI